MEYHYTVIYDDKTNEWTVESDHNLFYPDGNVYDERVFPGWFEPETGSDCEAENEELLSTLIYVVPTLPRLSDPRGIIRDKKREKGKVNWAWTST